MTKSKYIASITLLTSWEIWNKPPPIGSSWQDKNEANLWGACGHWMFEQSYSGRLGPPCCYMEPLHFS
jgi:hypothetical protein